MAGLQFQHDSIDDIPEPFRELYTEQDEKFVLTGIEGLKSQTDVDKVMGGLTKERADHKITKASLKVWDGMERVDVQSKLDRMDELELAASAAGKSKEEMDEQLDKLTEARVVSRMAPVERENVTFKTRCEELEAENTTLKGEKTQRTIGDAVGEACTKSKVEATALPDVKMLANQVFEVGDDGSVMTKENKFGVTPGLSAEVFLTEMQKTRPHWWPTSVGGNSNPGGNNFGGADNPWTDTNWNLTKQSAYVRDNGTDKAEQMAKAAGTTLGGRRPVAKK